MVHSGLTTTDRAFAASAGVSGTPFPTPTGTPSRRRSSVDDQQKASLDISRSAYYIIFVEGCERFCFYGLKAILLLYFMHFLQLNKDSATIGYHLFSYTCYVTPTIGATISDGFIGRYYTILCSSIIYFIGTLLLTITAAPPIGGRQLTGPVISLLLVAIGTGGIKPCVAAFGAEQLSMSNPKQLGRFFAFFYFSINFGSFLSTVITPLLRSQVTCFDYECYSLAFGVPSLLMLIAIILFVAGTSLYKRFPPKENIIAKFISIIFRAIRNAIRGSSSGSREHWLYNADDKYSTDDIEDVRSVLRVFLLFTPIPMFFALGQQTGSRWTYQASLMNGRLGSIGTIQPDQMQAFNSLFILLFIPLFEEVIYPIFTRWNFLIKPLQRMLCGMVIMVATFLTAAILQEAIQTRAEATPVRVHTNIYNGYNCTINFKHITLNPEQTFPYSCAKLLDEGVLFKSTCNDDSVAYKLPVDRICPSVLIVSEANIKSPGKTMELTPLTNPITQIRGVREFALLRVVSLDGGQTMIKTVPNQYTYNMVEILSPTDYQSVLAEEYQIENGTDGVLSVDTFQVYTTAVYTVLLYNTNDAKLRAVLFEDVPPFTVHILWQTIQYAFVACAEVFFSITGLVFAYSQSPRRYKTVIMSAWLLTTAFGDLIVVLVTDIRFVEDQAKEFLLFAILMIFSTFIFGILASRHKDFEPNYNDSEDQQLIINRDALEPDDAIPLSK